MFLYNVLKSQILRNNDDPAIKSSIFGAWIWIPTLLTTVYVILGKLLELSKLQFPRLALFEVYVHPMK